MKVMMGSYTVTLYDLIETSGAIVVLLGKLRLPTSLRRVVSEPPVYVPAAISDLYYQAEAKLIHEKLV